MNRDGMWTTESLPILKQNYKKICVSIEMPHCDSFGWVRAFWIFHKIVDTPNSQVV